MAATAQATTTLPSEHYKVSSNLVVICPVANYTTNSSALIPVPTTHTSTFPKPAKTRLENLNKLL